LGWRRVQPRRNGRYRRPKPICHQGNDWRGNSVFLARFHETLTQPSRPWHQFDVSKTLDVLRTSEAGLSADEARQRLARYGPNAFDLKEKRTPFRILLAQFTDFMIVVLIAAAIISGIVGDLKDTIVIGAIVVLNGVIGFIQEYRAEQALEALQKM